MVLDFLVNSFEGKTTVTIQFQYHHETSFLLVLFKHMEYVYVICAYLSLNSFLCITYVRKSFSLYIFPVQLVYFLWQSLIVSEK